MIPASYHNIQTASQYQLSGCQLGYSDRDVARFWAKVDFNGAGGCWLWLASSMDKYGHGQFTTRSFGKQRHLYAHRVAWELAHGPIPAGLVICHRCDVARCVFYGHLFIGTQADNLADAREKGRLDTSGPRDAFLTVEQRLAIFHAPGFHGVCTRLAEQYGVSRSRISMIRRGLFAGAPQQQLKPSTPDRQNVVRPFYGAHSPFELVPSIPLPIRGDVW